MKILQVSPFDYDARGGVNEHVNQLDHQFRALGHETRILAATSSEAGEKDDGHVYQLGTSIPIPSNGSTARVTLSPFILNKVRAFLEKERFDIVHLHEPLAPMLPLACLFYSDAVNVGTFHAARSFNFWYHYTKVILDLFVERLDLRIAVSPTAREFIDMHFPSDYEIVPNGIDLERFNPQLDPIAQFQDSRKNILFVGRYDEPRKGFNYLVRALPSVRKQFPKVRVIVVGKGNVERRYRMLEHYGLRDVVFVGAVRDEDLPRYYRTADVFVAPSTGRESFGLILLEAMASGATVVASNIPGYAAVLNNGEVGVLVEPKDEDELALALVRTLADTELRNRLRIAGLEHVKQFGWPRIASRIIELYESKLAEPRTAAPRHRLLEGVIGTNRG